MGDSMIALEDYLTSASTDADRLADMAESDLDTPVLSCPGWTVREFVRHVGLTHRWVERIAPGPKLGPGGRTSPDHPRSKTWGRGCASALGHPSTLSARSIPGSCCGTGRSRFTCGAHDEDTGRQCPVHEGLAAVNTRRESIPARWFISSCGDPPPSTERGVRRCPTCKPGASTRPTTP